MEPITSAQSDTIAAVATAPGAAGVSIVRISGPAALALADRVFQCPGPRPSERPAFTFTHGRVVSERRIVDEALLLIMRSPRSYTGEDVVELQGHGGSVQARRLLRCALAAGARLAEPGEFTRRAFLNGRLDLTQAEAVLDLIHARSERAAHLAVEQLEGSLSRCAKDLYGSCADVAADLEAALDFPEDELPQTVMPDLRERLRRTVAAVDALLATWDEGHVLRDGAAVVLSGRPNAGKSTILNTLLQRERAIVSPEPGTTRDVLEEGWTIEGFPLRLIDTAGLRESDHPIEREGIRRSHAERERADLHLYVVDASQPPHPDDLTHLQQLPPNRCLLILNKTDLGQHPRWAEPASHWTTVPTGHPHVASLERLQQAMVRQLGLHTGVDEHRAAIGERHRTLLLAARQELVQAEEMLASGREDLPALAADHLRDALEQLGQMTGQVFHQELLERIFSRFCIGK